MNKTLLLVDDEAPVRRALRRSLAQDGYRILEADCGEGALKLLAANRVDAILTDQRMPNMSGTELLLQARQNYPDTVRIMVSGQCDVDSLAQAVNDADLHQFVHKPWNDLRLRDILQKSLRTAPPVVAPQPEPAHLSLVTDFNRALYENRIEQNYLPVITTGSGEMAAVESSLKWRHPGLGTALHKDLMMLGDACHADKVLNTRYLCASFEQLQHWQALKLDHLRLMVRLSERMLMNPFTPQLLRQLLADYDVPATSLIITFSAANLRPAPYDIWSNLKKLRQTGAALCVDDFKLDSANMMLLDSLSIGLLRFKHQNANPFAGTTNNGDPLAGYRDLIEYGHKHNAGVIASGIHQTSWHYQLLTSGCDYLQGSLYGEARQMQDLPQAFAGPVCH